MTRGTRNSTGKRLARLLAALIMLMASLSAQRVDAQPGATLPTMVRDQDWCRCSRCATCADGDEHRERTQGDGKQSGRRDLSSRAIWHLRSCCVEGRLGTRRTTVQSRTATATSVAPASLAPVAELSRKDHASQPWSDSMLLVIRTSVDRLAVLATQRTLEVAP